MSSRLSLPALYIDSSCGMSYCGLPPPKMVPCRFFCIKVSMARFSVTWVSRRLPIAVSTQVPPFGDQHVVVDVFALDLPDRDDHFVRHQTPGDLGDTSQRG